METQQEGDQRPTGLSAAIGKRANAAAVIKVDKGVATITDCSLADGTYEIRSSHYFEELEILKIE